MGRREKALHLLFGFALMLVMVLAMSTAVLAKEEVTYLDWDRSRYKHVEKTITEYNLVQASSGDVVWGDSVDDESWYVVDGQVPIDGRIKVRGDVHLILKDDAVLYANNGIYTEGILRDRGNLYIYGQSGGNGTLYARSYGDSGIKIVGGNLSVDGGIINAEGTDAISVKWNRELSGGSMEINGGMINAEGKNNGITADMDCTINWGVINASGSARGISTSVLMMLDGYLTAYGPEGYGIDAAVGINDGLIIRAGDSAAASERIDRDYFEHDHYQRWASIVREADDSSGVIPISYDEDDSESYIVIVTYEVKKGAWNDGTAEDKYVILVGKDPSDLKLTDHDIPEVGKKPDQGYKAGGWITAPPTDTPVPEETTYTYYYTNRTAAGTIHTVGGSRYTVTSAGTAALYRAQNRKNYTLPASIQIAGKAFQVTGIEANAFRGTKVKTLTVSSKALTKASVRNSLSGSKVRTVKVKVGKKKENKKYVKKYRKIFTRKNAGRKASVKR